MIDLTRPEPVLEGGYPGDGTRERGATGGFLGDGRGGAIPTQSVGVRECSGPF